MIKQQKRKSILFAAMILFGIGAAVYAGNLILGQNGSVISRDEVWLTPFESIVTTEYDLGDGFTATETTSTVWEIHSVKHTDEESFTKEQWDEILDGIAKGEIVWED